jgi:hypothetical protein
MDEMISILQINVNHSHPAQDLALATANCLKADIICLTEPYKRHDRVTSTPGWTCFSQGSAAILIRHCVQHRPIVGLENVAAIRIGRVCINSAYVSHNQWIGPTIDAIEGMIEGEESCIITGDFNTRWPEFTQKKLLERDIKMMEFISQEEVMVMNINTLTLEHQSSLSTNDYTLTKNAKCCRMWNPFLTTDIYTSWRRQTKMRQV